MELSLQDPQQNENTHAEYYLEQLRRKVEHQVKNPFSLPFMNFTFEELTNWKNTVIQLDTTSRLYAQRVDFLHDGAVKIVDAVFRRETKNEEYIAPEIKEIGENYLEDPQQLNGEMETVFEEVLLWRQICQKSENLSQIMLHQIELGANLSLNLGLNQRTCECLPRQIIEFSFELPKIPNSLLQILSEIQSLRLDIEEWQANNKPGCEKSFIYFQDNFTNLQIEFSRQEVDEHGIASAQEEILQAQTEGYEVFVENLFESSFELFESESEFNPFKYIEKQKKSKIRNRQKLRKKKQKKVEQEESIHFVNGIPERRNAIFMRNKQQNQPRRAMRKNKLLPKDLGIWDRQGARIFGERQPKKQNKKAEPQEQFKIENCETSCRVNASFQMQFSLRNLKKQLSKVLEEGSLISFQAVQTQILADPLDLFLALLHVAAEENYYIQGKSGELVIVRN